MSYIEDYWELFRVASTGYAIRCELCGTTYNRGLRERGGREGMLVSYTILRERVICECCFERFEEVASRIASKLISRAARLTSPPSGNTKRLA